MDGSEDREFQSGILKNRGCFCDEDCGRFGDCCFDSQYFDATEQEQAHGNYECLSISHGRGIYVKSICPKHWEDRKVRNKCRQKNDENMDYLMLLPTLSEMSQTVYRNVYCALCNAERRFFILDTQIECQMALNQSYYTREYDKTYFKPNTQRKAETAVNCFKSSSSIGDVSNFKSTIIRSCIPNIVDTCANNKANDEMRKNCDTYTSIVQTGGKFFKNPFCAFCSDAFLNESIFRGRIINNKRSRLARHSLGDQSSTNDKILTVKRDSHGESYNEVLRKTLPYHETCPANLMMVVTNKLTLLNKERTEHSAMDRIQLTAAWTTLVEDEGEFRQLSGCFGYEAGDECIFQFKDYAGSYPPGLDLNILNRILVFIANTICLNFSIIFLSSHLLVVSLTSHLWNPSNKMVTSFCLSLLIGNIFILIGQFPMETFGTVVSVLTYYSLLVHYLWVLTMSFDVWRTTCSACSQSPEQANSQEGKFLIYSILSLVLPSIAALISLLAHLTDVDPSLKPRFGRRSSWFGQSSAMVIYFAVPVGIVMILSIFFLLFAIVMFFRFKDDMETRTKRIIWTYSQLILMAKLTWMTGFFSYWLEWYSLWICFMILHALQSLLIFFMHTGKNNILNVLHRRRRRNTANRAAPNCQREAQGLVSVTNNHTSSQRRTESTSV